MAVKEVTRQVSVQCVERGIILKAIFDSYLRMIDLIFQDGFVQRRQLAMKFAKATEKQINMQDIQLEHKE
jgi:hypothetical protein